MNLDGLFTRTRVTFDSSFHADELILDGKPLSGPHLQRVSDFLDQVRELAGSNEFARVESENNFPMGAGSPPPPRRSLPWPWRPPQQLASTCQRKPSPAWRALALGRLAAPSRAGSLSGR